MRCCVIACNLFRHEVEVVCQESPFELDFVWFELGEHARPGRLRSKLQEQIDLAVDYDLVLLLYGLCGRATDGLVARQVPLVLVRSHDCGGILLGSRLRFEEIFREQPSTPFSSIGIVEHGDYFFDDGELVRGDAFAELVARYGEENARYIRETMPPRLHGELPPVYFISMPEAPAAEAHAACRERAARDGRPFRELTGNIRLIRMLLCGDHPGEEFLHVPPGGVVRQAGDWDEIIRVASDCNFC